MVRNYKKEREWQKKVYRRYEFKTRLDNGENERFLEVLGDSTFTEWAKRHLAEDYAKLHPDE